MVSATYVYSLDILRRIEEFKDQGDHLKLVNVNDKVIIITSIDDNGISQKSILSSADISSQESISSTTLIDYIMEILGDRKPIGYIGLQDECGFEVLYIIEIIQSPNSILILGAGHVGRALSIFASILGYAVTLVDDREEFLQDKSLTDCGVKKALSFFDTYFDSAPIYSNSAIIIVTRGHQYDEICLRKAIYSQASYIGMIGSKRRVLKIINNLRKDTLSDMQSQNLERVYAPIGIGIGARSPQEIAISILAQVIQVMNSSSR